MRRVGRNDNDTAGLRFPGFIADGKAGSSFDDEPNFRIGMGMQRRSFPRRRVDDVSGERRALLFAYEIVRHPNERQLFKVEKAHDPNLDLAG